MEQFPCKVTIDTLDRRKKYLTKKIYEQNTFFSVRHIEEDKSFHMIVKGGTKTEVFISKKLQISDNIVNLGSIALNVPEFRAMILIEHSDGDEDSGVLDKILDILSPQETPSVIDDTIHVSTTDSNDENNSNHANHQSISPSTKHSTASITTPEKQRQQPKPEKKKLRSPLKSGFTPSKKKDRSIGQRSSPIKMTQITSFLSTSSSNNGSTRASESNQRRSNNSSTRESLSPDKTALTQTQLEVLERCKEGANVFLTGGAGTGKSHLLKCIMQEMVLLHGKQAVFVTATTGIAAVHIGGTTVHQFAGIRPGDTITEIGDAFKQAFKNQSVVRRWRQAQVLIVDEISMMSPQTLELINSVAQDSRGTTAMMGGVQVIFTGDFFQLPPVMKVNDKIRHQHQYQHNNTSNTTSTNTYGYSQLTSMTQDINMTQNMSATATVASSSSTSSLSSSREQRFCFQSAIWKEMFSRKNCFMLKEVHRQKDAKFSKLLNAIRWGDCSDEVCDAFESCVGKVLDSSDGILPTKIFTHRRDVDNLNSVELKRLNGDSRTYRAIDDGEKMYVQMLQNHCPARQEISLKLGAQVVLLKTIDPLDGLVNGSRGVVVDFTKTTKRPVVKFTGGICRPISNESFPISLGGRVVAQRYQLPLDLAWGISVHKSQGISVDKAVLFIKNAFEYGQAYVALSRVKSIAGLSLSHTLKHCFIKAHPDVKTFYNSLRTEGERGDMTVSSKTREERPRRIRRGDGDHDSGHCGSESESDDVDGESWDAML